MNELESITYGKQGDISNIYLKVSIFILLSGVLFTIGQSAYLNSFVYLRTFTYIDFLTNSILIAPFLLIGVFSYAIFVDFIVTPMSEGGNLLRAIKSKDSILIFNTGASFLLGIGIPITLILVISYPSDLILISVIAIFIAIVLRYIFNKTKIPDEVTSSNSEIDVEKTPQDIYKKVVWCCILVFLFGIWSIQIQDELSTDATLTMKDKGEVVEVNILASNSNFIVSYRSGMIEIVPRSEIKIIGHNSVYFKKQSP